MQSEHLQRPRLLVFTLGERQESRRRRLLPAALRGEECRLHRACLDQALEAGRQACFDLEVSSPSPLGGLAPDIIPRRQARGSFAQRITAALRRAFARSGQPLVLVGSDVPGLRAEHFQQTREALAADPRRVVVGPSPDGGFYLLAATQPLDSVLDQVRWRCRGTLASLRRALRRAGRPLTLLAPLADLDRRSDLEQWLAGQKLRRSLVDSVWGHLVALLLEILAALRRAGPAYRRSAQGRGTLRTPWVRGPPPITSLFVL